MNRSVPEGPHLVQLTFWGFFFLGLKMGLFENTVTRNKVKILYFEKVQFETTFAKRAPSLSCSKNVL